MPEASSEKTAQRISDVLQEGTVYLRRHHIKGPQREAEHLLAAVLKCSRLHLFLRTENELTEKDYQQFLSDIKRRAVHEPLQYITGQVEFCDMTLAVSKGVFIPRPETELIVEAAKAYAPPRRILDLCTGSGALAVALARTFSDAAVTGIDCEDAALVLAARNAQTQGVAARTLFLKGNLFEPLKKQPNKLERFDLIVANPPYISETDRDTLPVEVRDFEPEVALFAADEGREVYRRILEEAPLFLSEEGVIILELGQGQSEWLRSYVADEMNNTQSGWAVTLIQDWANIDRIACLSKTPVETREGVNG